MIRVLLVDDEALLRGGVRMILDAQEDIEVVGEAADGEDAVRRVRETRPDVVLMDIRMPRTDGLEATRRVLGLPSPPRVIVLTTFDLDEHVYSAIRAGASGFLLKTAPPAELAAAVRAAARGQTLLAPEVTRRLIEEFASRPRPQTAAPPEYDELTSREREVLLLIARGLSNAEIADHLVVSEATVKTHVNRVFAKLRLRDRVQAVVLGYEMGLVRPGERSWPTRRVQ